MPAAAFVVPGPLDTPTGGYGYDRRIVKGLRERGWTVDVHQLDDSFPAPTAAAHAEARRVLDALADGTVVVVDGLAYGVLAEEAAAHAARLRLVALVHHPLAAESGLEAATAAALRASERAALRCARRVVVTSRATAALVGDYDVDPGKVVVVVPGTDPAPLAAGSEGPILQLLCVGSLIPRKGHDALLDALASLDQRNWALTCVGGFRDMATVRRIRSRLEDGPLAARVTLAGELTGDALEARYLASDLFVLPTLFEGYGMAVAEALAHGLPVIATPTGAIGELVTPDAGILVPPGDAAALAAALAQVLDDDSVRRRLTDGARARRDHLPTWAAAAEAMAHALQELGA